MSKSDLTRQRILDAATAEFAAHGFAGARVDRIAKAAPANKSQIYAYFGDKETLFDLTLERALEQGAHTLSADPTNLPEYAGEIFDHLERHPELFRLGLWRQLERPHSGSTREAESWQQKVDTVTDGMRMASPVREFTAKDLLALVLALTQTWHLAPDALAATRTTAERRGLIVEAVARLLRSS